MPSPNAPGRSGLAPVARDPRLDLRPVLLRVQTDLFRRRDRAGPGRDRDVRVPRHRPPADRGRRHRRDRRPQARGLPRRAAGRSWPPFDDAARRRAQAPGRALRSRPSPARTAAARPGDAVLARSARRPLGPDRPPPCNASRARRRGGRPRAGGKPPADARPRRPSRHLVRKARLRPALAEETAAPARTDRPRSRGALPARRSRAPGPHPRRGGAALPPGLPAGPERHEPTTARDGRLRCAQPRRGAGVRAAVSKGCSPAIRRTGASTTRFGTTCSASPSSPPASTPTTRSGSR